MDIVVLSNFISSGIPPSDPYEFWAADLNEDYLITLQDAYLLSDYILNHPCCPQQGPRGVDLVNVSVDYINGLYRNDYNSFTINLDSEYQLRAIHINLVYEGLIFNSIQPSAELDELHFVSNAEANELGLIVFGIGNHDIPQGIVELATVYYTDTLEKLNDRMLYIEGQAVTSNNELLQINMNSSNKIEEESPEKPKAYGLLNPYPNPFNSITTIRYSLPKEETISIKIYSVNGQEVFHLYSGVSPSGDCQLMWDAEGFSSGLYIVKMYYSRGVISKKLLLIK